MKRYVQYCTKFRAQESTDHVSWYLGRRNTDRLIVSVRTHSAMTWADGAAAASALIPTACAFTPCGGWLAVVPSCAAKAEGSRLGGGCGGRRTPAHVLNRRGTLSPHATTLSRQHGRGGSSSPLPLPPRPPSPPPPSPPCPGSRIKGRIVATAACHRCWVRGGREWWRGRRRGARGGGGRRCSLLFLTGGRPGRGWGVGGGGRGVGRCCPRRHGVGRLPGVTLRNRKRLSARWVLAVAL